MYILINKDTKIIVATAANPVSEKACARNNQVCYEIDNSDFNIDMLGSKLENFSAVKQD